MRRLFPMPTLAMLCFGCAAIVASNYRVHEIDYTLALVRVDRPEKTEERWGKVESIEVSEGDRFAYRDSLIEAWFTIRREGIAFEIVNRTQHSMRLIWDEAVLISPEGVAGKVFHSGIKYTDRNLAQPASVIPANGRFLDAAFPTDGVWFSYGKWHIHSLLLPDLEISEEASSVPSDSFVRAGAANVGNKIGLLLPLYVEGITNEYTFWFEVKEYEVLKPVWGNEHWLFKEGY